MVRIKFFSTVEFLKIFIGTFGAIWTFLESGERFMGVIVIADKGWLYYLGILLLSTALSVGYAKYAALRNTNYLIIDLSKKIQDKMKSLNRRHKMMMVDQSYFKLLFVYWRIESELEKGKMVDGGHFALPAKTAFDYIIYVFSSLLNRLRNTDEFITLSNIDFWERVIKTRNTFLTDNLRAVERNVIIKRIVLVDRRVLDSKKFSQEREKINYVARGIYERYRRNTVNFERMDWFFYVSDQYDLDNQAPVPYAIMYNKASNEHLAVLPRFSETIEEDSQIEFHFSQRKNDDNILPYVHRYNETNAQKTNLYSIPDF